LVSGNYYPVHASRLNVHFSALSQSRL
jgi:hypothetical protein